MEHAQLPPGYAGVLFNRSAVHFLERARQWLHALRHRRRFQKAYLEGARTAKAGPHPLVIVLDNMRPSFSPAVIIETAEAFGVRAVYVIGTEYFDPLMGMKSLSHALRHIPLRFFRTFEEAYRELVDEDYSIFALEPPRNYRAPSFLHSTDFPKKTALVVGHETRGISFSPQAFDRVVCLSIQQYGVAACLRARVAAAVAMYEYVRQHGRQ